MFADTLESSWTDRSRRAWSAFASLGLQLLMLGFLLLLPVLRPQGLPLLRRLTTPVSAGHLPAEPPPVQARTQPSTAPLSNFRNNQLMQPSQIPIVVERVTDDVPPPQQFGPAGPYIPGLAGIGDPNGVPGALRDGVRPVMPSVPPPPPRPIAISHMREGDLIRRVQPAYPQLARAARIEGEVILQAVISKEGTIEDLRVVRGHPMLVRAAIDAVSQWRYRPYILNNDPVEVETQITVNFSLRTN